MDLHSTERAADSFQQPVTAAEIRALCRRSLGADVRVTAATEIGVGTYNSTYRLDLERLDLEREAPVVLRIAPTPARQSPAARDAMRNEYAAAPFLAPLGLLVPRILAADFTHQLIDRDYMVQTLLAGVPASTGLTVIPFS
ncbi:phosphotransferase family protein [Jatrophihabitans lederbergiae]|uniref:Phosphotransferase n=1 Tax=Jatrophihabitans lederbergiae TaxID=3075547 RepID=A0ABU2JDG2_9ACTN|nr:phosphotransferase [Jatrophihabitans sp. DSM 44399]MDT0263020.1 phosphotransferase [Jatrophihabitans sp. DSM 44399]